MLGEVAQKTLGWIQQGKTDSRRLRRPGTAGRIQDGCRTTAGFARSCDPTRYETLGKASFEHLIVGRYSEAVDADIHRLDGAIYINKEELSRPGQIRDGYFPGCRLRQSFVRHSGAGMCPHRMDHRPSAGRRQTSSSKLDRLPFGKTIPEGARTLLTMVKDPDCTVFLTLSGAMTIAKMGLVICDMVDLGMVQVISSTGALMAHGLIEGVGLKHYKHNPAHTDTFLAERQLNRVTDTLEPEENFSHIEEIVDKVLWTFNADKPISPSMFHDAVGQAPRRSSYPDDRGILKSTYEKKVPVLCPAFVDSEIGNDLYVHNERRRREELSASHRLAGTRL